MGEARRVLLSPNACDHFSAVSENEHILTELWAMPPTSRLYFNSEGRNTTNATQTSSQVQVLWRLGARQQITVT